VAFPLENYLPFGDDVSNEFTRFHMSHNAFDFAVLLNVPKSVGSRVSPIVNA
jgi:hypothetical protein